MNNLTAAIKMELAGEKYYMEQATANQGNSLQALFVLLAKEESEHAKKLQANFEKLTTRLADEQELSGAKSVFKGIRAFKSANKAIPQQLEVYRFALKKEQESIQLYEKLLATTTDDGTKSLLAYLITQEKEHFAVFEELIILVSRPEDWIEAAEFGIREEY
ncbi:MAG: ferritin family protein [Clostridia bacterium]